MTAENYDSWFRKKVQEALDDKSPEIPHKEAMALSAARINEALKRRGKDKTD
ncbi:antitoxin [Salmonella enterica]|uniref:type II toxin-antitoxin system RelB family antitoxin n=1 Tax=Salmonella enterica TaxID=28901 RepID=UPI00138A8918|nr:antitoxin [Salmonella enterica]EBV1305013.1 antitoxin [Salmonella enterica subsp. enterica serovar Typhimurium]EAX3607009.1 antitoxin [Salmonella enterica]EBE4779551.1 antitoxin [Salmonella enterica]EGW6280490.1 antitoxin [Salmonella enterica]